MNEKTIILPLEEPSEEPGIRELWTKNWNIGWNEGWQEGFQRGLKKGFLIERIIFTMERLGLPMPDRDHLGTLTVERLEQHLTQLKQYFPTENLVNDR